MATLDELREQRDALRLRLKAAQQTVMERERARLEAEEQTRVEAEITRLQAAVDEAEAEVRGEVVEPIEERVRQ